MFKIRNIGKYTYGAENIHIFTWGEDTYLDIGSFCSIGENISVYLGGDHRIDWVSTYPFGHIHQDVFNTYDGSGHPLTKGNVSIGNDVWIGNNVTIMSGSNIGDGACLGNGSVIAGYVEPYSIVIGNPARLLYHRFEEDIVRKLLQYKWWDLEDEKINELAPLLCSNRFDELFEKLEAYGY